MWFDCRTFFVVLLSLCGIFGCVAMILKSAIEGNFLWFLGVVPFAIMLALAGAML